MRKILLALSTVFLLASFTNSADKTIVLKDIDGTLLQSYAVINQVNGEYTVTFTTDATTVVTSNTDSEGTHIHLVATSSSNSTATHTLTFKTASLDFNNYFESNLDVASVESMSASVLALKKPRTLL
jgi:hypothetical protein